MSIDEAGAFLAQPEHSPLAVQLQHASVEALDPGPVFDVDEKEENQLVVGEKLGQLYSLGTGAGTGRQ